MKKLIPCLLLLVYLPHAVEMVINVHYCFGELQSVSFYHVEDSSCCERFVLKAPCCEDQQIQFSVDEDQQLASALNLQLPLGECMDIPAPKPVPAQLRQQPLHPPVNAPPTTPPKPWIQYQRLIWYG